MASNWGGGNIDLHPATTMINCRVVVARLDAGGAGGGRRGGVVMNGMEPRLQVDDDLRKKAQDDANDCRMVTVLQPAESRYHFPY